MAYQDYQVEIYKELKAKLTEKDMLLLNTLLDKSLVEYLDVKKILVVSVSENPQKN